MKLELDINKESDDILLKKIARVLADFKRLEILRLIGGNEDYNYGEIAKEIERSPTAVTNHMNWIRESGIIEDLSIEGKRGKMQKIPRLKITKIIIKLK